jgi:hypothetical protein
MKNFFVAIILLSTTLTFSQKKIDYDKIFNDGDKESKYQVGINLSKLIGGTLSLYSNIKLTPKIVVVPTFGIVPFNYSLTPSLIIRDNEFSDYAIYKGVKNGYNFGLGTRFYLGFKEKSKYDIFGQYYGVGYDYWKMPASNDSLTVFKQKINFVGGLSADLPGRFNLDVEYGIFVGFFKLDETFQSYAVFSPYTYNYYEIISPVDKRTVFFGPIFNIGLNFAI